MKVSRPEDLGSLFRRYRALHRLTQAQLAERLQTTQKWVSHIESGKPTAYVGGVLRALNQLGYVIDISLDDDPLVSSKRRRFSIDDIVDG